MLGLGKQRVTLQAFTCYYTPSDVMQQASVKALLQPPKLHNLTSIPVSAELPCMAAHTQ